MLTPASRPTRHRLVDAAEKLMRTTGLAGATTKAIAREAGCSEAALYKHFASKEELFVRVIHERLPNIGPLIGELMADPGERGVQECLTALARQSARFYEEAFPMFGTLLADPALLAHYRDGLRKIDAGPHLAVEGTARYLERERERGRIRADADPHAAAALLMGACFQRAFFIQVSGADRVQPAEEFAQAVAAAAWAALRP